MNCSKCNNEIPNGAKFCTVCGTPVAQAEAAPAKIFCAKCGLELAAGAKFCTSCGTPMAANVSLNKEPSADDLVAAMNTAAPAAAAVPTPASVPAPAATAVPTPVPTPAAPAASVMQPTYNNGFAPTGAPAAPQMPNYAPTTGQMPATGDAADFNGAAVAAAVVPEKVKKSPAGKIVLIIVAVLVVLIGGAAGWFFANRASFLSTFMGKPKYAAMVEKETFKSISKEIDTKALSSQIKAVSSVAGALATPQMNPMLVGGYGGYGFMSDSTTDAAYAPMLNSYSNNPFDSLDISGMITSYHEFMQTTYGADAISGKISLRIEDLGAFEDEDVEEVLEIINGLNINYNYAASENALGTIVGAEFGNGSVIDMQAVMQDDGSIYVSMPFASKTGFLIKTNASGSSSGTTKTEALDLDPEEIDRLLEELVGIYTKHVESSSVTMDKGSLYVAGKEISGKLIVADINGKNLENLFKEMFEHIANDEYFSKQIVEYANNFDEDYTVSDFKNDITDMVSDMEASESDKLVIRTVVNNSGKTLAKSFGLVADGEQEIEIAFADNDSMSVFEILAEGETVMKMVNEKTDDKNGKITISVSDMDSHDPSEISVIVDYKGVEKVTYGKTEVEVGTYTISMKVPRNSSFDDDEIDTINNSSFTVGTTVNGSTINYTIGATISGAAKVELNMDLTFNDDTTALKTPSDVIDITDIANGAEPDKATQDKLQAWLGDLMTAVENSGLDEIFGDLGGGTVVTPTIPSNPTNPTNPSNPDDTQLRDRYWELEDEVWDAYFDVYTWTGSYNVYDGAAFDRAKDFQDALYDLEERISDKAFDFTAELSEKELNDFKDEFDSIYKDAESVLKGLYDASTVKDKPAPTLPFAGTNGSSQGGVYGPDGNLITENPNDGFMDER